MRVYTCVINVPDDYVDDNTAQLEQRALETDLTLFQEFITLAATDSAVTIEFKVEDID